ncbi:hypothetical protein [Brevibacillus fortis]|uniref:hypothetical protein n=1 Tax=Brevibacillus TaxID=55080 RepID=UPI0038FC6179
MKAKVSIDKFVVEYTDVTFGAYYGLVIRAAKSGELYKQTMYHGDGYSHELHLRKADGAYLHVFYRNWREPEGSTYTLRLETRPEYYFHFKGVLDRLRRVANGIYYVNCDLAYDVQASMKDVVVFPNDGRRKMKHYKGTRYFGDKHQRKTNGFCRNYNKRLELLENQNVVIDHELTRIEIVDKPEKRIPVEELLHHPPKQNKHYFAAVVTDWGNLPKKRAQQARQLRDGVEIEKKKDWYTRKVVKETLAPSSQVDFNELAREAWEPLLEELCGVLLGQQEPQVQERQLQMAVTNTVYDEPREENDSKNVGCADFGKYRILRNNTGVRKRLNQQRMTGLFELRKKTGARWSVPSSRAQQKNFNFFYPPLYENAFFNIYRMSANFLKEEAFMKDKQIKGHYVREEYLKQRIQALDAAIGHLVRFNAKVGGTTLNLCEVADVVDLLDEQKAKAEQELYHVRRCILDLHMKQSTKSVS